VTTLFSPSVAWAAGAVVSNAWDLVRWAESLAAGAGISAALHAERLQPVPASGAIGYGLGVVLINGWIGHDGQIPGYDALMLSKPGVGTIVVLVNQSTGGEAAIELAAAVAQAKFGPAALLSRVAPAAARGMRVLR
jgi:D-alanyl-D-alanine carboxypeptidase